MNPAFNPPVGERPTMEWLPVAALSVDASYQRSTDNETSRTLIRKIARFWDWSLCQPLAVTRRADGSLFVVDGQHRHAAAQLRGDIDELPCVVTAYASLSDEAAAFVSINQQRKPLGKVDLYRAALAAGDTEAAAIEAMITAAGLKVAPHSNYTAWKPGMLFCVPGIQRAYRVIGPAATRRALDLLAEAFDGHVLQFAGQMLEGLFGFAAKEGAASGFDRAAAVRCLSRRSQSTWVKVATQRRLASGQPRRLAMQAVIAEVYATEPRAAAAADLPPRISPPPVPRQPAPAPVAPKPEPAKVAIPAVRPAPTSPPAAKADVAPKPFKLRFANFEEQLEAARRLGVIERPVLRTSDDGIRFGVVGEIL